MQQQRQRAARLQLPYQSINFQRWCHQPSRASQSHVLRPQRRKATASAITWPRRPCTNPHATNAPPRKLLSTSLAGLGSTSTRAAAHAQTCRVLGLHHMQGRQLTSSSLRPAPRCRCGAKEREHQGLLSLTRAVPCRPPTSGSAPRSAQASCGVLAARGARPNRSCNQSPTSKRQSHVRSHRGGSVAEVWAGESLSATRENHSLTWHDAGYAHAPGTICIFIVPATVARRLALRSCRMIPLSSIERF